MPKLKTWVEIKQKAVENNIRQIKSLLKPKTKLWAVVKSNAYGHGLINFSLIAQQSGADGFCVDSVPEGLKLRKAVIKKPILVLGPTLFRDLMEEARKNNLAITISNFENLPNLLKIKNKPQFHIKIDSGMHRQGFYPSEIPKLIKTIKAKKLSGQLEGIYTHFASAKDLNYPTYTDLQFANFGKAISLFKRAGFANLTCHAAATGGTLINQKYHLDAVRTGIGLYGLWPSKELELQVKNLRLQPVLSWHSLISEIKTLKKGDFIGYDLIERTPENTRMAIIPIGYWHGFPRSLSGIGEVLINGKRAKILGRVSMDIIAVDIKNNPCKTGDKATFIGSQKSDRLLAFDVALKSGTTHYEFLTRINPLIERITV